MFIVVMIVYVCVDVVCRESSVSSTRGLLKLNVSESSMHAQGGTTPLSSPSDYNQVCMGFLVELLLAGFPSIVQKKIELGFFLKPLPCR